MPSLNEMIFRFGEMSANLNPTEIWMIYALVVLLLMYLAFRIMGISGLLGMVLVVFFGWVLYNNGTVEKYQEKKSREASRMEMLDQEMNKP